MPVTNDQATLAVGGAAGSWFVVWMIKFLMRSVKQEKLESIMFNSEGGSYMRLEAEIVKLTTRVKELEDILNAKWANELGDTSDIASLDILLSMMPCGKCELNDDSFSSAKRALDRMKYRRNPIEYEGMII